MAFTREEYNLFGTRDRVALATRLQEVFKDQRLDDWAWTDTWTPQQKEITAMEQLGYIKQEPNGEDAEGPTHVRLLTERGKFFGQKS